VVRLPIVTLVYSAALLATNGWLETSSARTERSVLVGTSTDLWHLAHTPWTVLPASAFFTRGGLPYALVGCLVCVGLLERQAGSVATLAVGVLGHLIGTAVSEGVVAIRIAVHDLPTSAAHAIDVGPSYVLVACAATVIAWPRARLWTRVTCAVLLAPIVVFTAWRLPEGQIDAVGHLTAGFVGAMCARWLTRHRLRAQELPSSARGRLASEVS
jgi:hypothetical protein